MKQYSARTEFLNFILLIATILAGMVVCGFILSRPLPAQSTTVTFNGTKVVKLDYPLFFTPICNPNGAINIRSCFGAFGDHQQGFGSMTAGSAVLTLSAGSFLKTDAGSGKIVEVYGAGASGATLVTTVTGWTSPTTVSLATAASVTATGYVNAGHDDTAAINSAIAAACSSYPIGSVYLPIGEYFVSGLNPITSACSGLTIFGDNEINSALVGRASSTSDILTLNGVAGTPTELRNMSVRGAYGSVTVNCVTLNNTNGIRLSTMWLNGCADNLNVTGGSALTLQGIASELALYNNFAFTGLLGCQFSDLQSYQAGIAGFYFVTAPPYTIGGVNQGHCMITNAWDTESAQQGWEINGYNDLSLVNVGVDTGNNRRPSVGIDINNSARIHFSDAHVLHSGTLGIHVRGSSADIKFANLVTDQVGNYTSLGSGALVGVQVDQGPTGVEFIGGSISNVPGTCMIFSGFGQVIGMKFSNCASANSSTAGLYGLVLSPTSSSTDGQFIQGNQFFNSGYTYGTAIDVTAGANETFIGNNVFGGYATAYTKAGGTTTGGYNSFTP